MSSPKETRRPRQEIVTRHRLNCITTHHLSQPSTASYSYLVSITYHFVIQILRNLRLNLLTSERRVDSGITWTQAPVALRFYSLACIALNLASAARARFSRSIRARISGVTPAC